MSVDDVRKSDFYARLGIPRDADYRQIETAYLQLCQKHDPEVRQYEDGTSAARDVEVFRLIYEAYNVLSDHQKKKDYDQMLARSSVEDTAQRASTEERLKRSRDAHGIMRVNLEDLPTRPYVSVLDKRRMRQEQKFSGIYSGVMTPAPGISSAEIHLQQQPTVENLDASGFFHQGHSQRSLLDLLLLFCGIGLPFIAILVSIAMVLFY